MYIVSLHLELQGRIYKGPDCGLKSLPDAYHDGTRPLLHLFVRLAMMA